MPFQIFHANAGKILSPVSGFIKDAGFTHSLTPSRNCTFGCSYCYVPTMRFQGGLKQHDWTHWGQWTTFKQNARYLLLKELRPDQLIYCSPLTDPYQPAEGLSPSMPPVLEAIAERPPRAFVIQTRGPLISRDLRLLREVARRTNLRVSFSITTDREDVRRVFEPHCALIEERWQTVRLLREWGIPVTATLAPILPCDPDALIDRALLETDGPIVGDPFHVRQTKRSGATTRDPALAICRKHGWEEWLDPEFHSVLLERMRLRAFPRTFAWGPPGFGQLLRELNPPLWCL